MTSVKQLRIVVSNGGYRFHLAPLAAELDARGVLAGFITAGWPSGVQAWCAERLRFSAACRRFLDRKEPISPDLVHSVGKSEVYFKGADVALRRWSKRWQQRVHCRGFRVYSQAAESLVSKLSPDLYHYRNCYGLASVKRARDTGAVALCDHSIAHPICLQWMENNRGQYPDRERFAEIRDNLLPLYRAMSDDLERADHIVVNSDFVKQTCVYTGIPADKVHVVYWGVDDAFLEHLDAAPVSPSVEPATMLFAGGWQIRKGIPTLVEALEELPHEWRLEIAAGMEPEATAIPAVRRFLNREQVQPLGMLSRQDLANLMQRHRVFVFPSYCEGSARVVFEALAAGCYVITTPNSGSIVEDGVHGRLVPAGDSRALRDAIAEVIRNPDQAEKIGQRNAALVRQEYRQSQYGNRVLELYGQLTHHNCGRGDR